MNAQARNSELQRIDASSLIFQLIYIIYLYIKHTSKKKHSAL